MKKIFFLLMLFACGQQLFSQQLQDGIYLVDKAVSGRHLPAAKNRSIVQLSPYFIDEDPENYEPLVIKTDHFFPFELAGMPLLQKQQGCDKILFVRLTGNAQRQLADFTTLNLASSTAIIVNGEAVAQYIITKPVTTALLKITPCSGVSCKVIYQSLKKQVRQ